MYRISTVGVLLLLLSTICAFAIFNNDSIEITEESFDILNNLYTLSKNVMVEESEVRKLQDKIEDIENEVQKKQQQSSELYEKSEEILKQIEDLKMTCGLTDVRGPGITLRISDNVSDDPYTLSDKIVHDLDVAMIVNALKAAGAEAITINGKRILNFTEVVCLGPVIRVNDEAVAAPFILKAIGNPDDLMAAVTEPGTYAYDIKVNYGIQIDAMKNMDSFIAGYNKVVDINYIKSVE